MIKNKTYTIENWKAWDKELDKATDSFHTSFGYYPNILVASEETHTRIDKEANKKRNQIVAGDKETAKQAPPPWIQIAEVALKHCLVELAVDNKVPTDKVMLVYDSSPEFAQP